MKHVVKGIEPQPLLDWKAHANEEWTPSYDKLQNPEKRALHEALLSEQGFVCCYCGGRIDRGSSHIEHFRPQEAHADLELEFANLHASCLRETAPRLPLHCGHAKGSHFDEAQAISPLDPGCEARFSYRLDGGITGNDAQASYMCDLLCLQVGVLQRRREQALAGVFDNDFLTSASGKELGQIASGFRQRDNAILPDFGHVIANCAEQLLRSD